MDWLEAFGRLLPFLGQYPQWVRLVFAAWIVVTAATLVVFVVAPRQQSLDGGGPTTNPRGPEPALLHSQDVVVETGDDVIDKVLRELAALERSEHRVPDARLVTALNPLFSRAAFLDMREENWNYFLYVLCRTRIILAEYVDNFRNPTIREDLGSAIEIMIQLQNEVASIYGGAFSITEHLEHYKDDKEAFTDNLPNILSNQSGAIVFLEIPLASPQKPGLGALRRQILTEWSLREGLIRPFSYPRSEI